MVKYETGLMLQNLATLSGLALKVAEYKDRGFVVLRLSPDAEGVQEALTQLGIQLPDALEMWGSFDAKLVKWISPDEYLVTLPLTEKDQFVADAQRVFAGLFVAVVDNSGGYSLLRISGLKRYEVLSKLCFYDLRGNLPVGKVVSTLLARAPAIFYRLDDDSLMWMVRYSFADYAWRAFLNAGAEYQA